MKIQLSSIPVGADFSGTAQSPNAGEETSSKSHTGMILFLILGHEYNRICDNSITIRLNNKLTATDMLYTPTCASDMASTYLAGF